MNGRHPRPMLRAKGNLSYLEFIRLVKHLWEQGHPDIPIIPAGTGDIARYPCIIYGLEVRRVHDSEPKPRYRETLDDHGTAVLISAQRFVNVISFSAVSESDSDHGPEEAEAVVEAFEDFMQKMVPVFKEAGVSEFTYSRRLNDQEQNRSGQGTVSRTVAYTVTLEKLARIGRQQLQQIFNAIDEILLDFRVIKPVYDGPPVFSTAAGENFIVVTGMKLSLGDTVYIASHESIADELPDVLYPGYYIILNIIGNPTEHKYELARLTDTVEGGYTPVDITAAAGGGRIFYVKDSKVDIRITDTFDAEDKEMG